MDQLPVSGRPSTRRRSGRRPRDFWRAVQDLGDPPDRHPPEGGQPCAARPRGPDDAAVVAAASQQAVRRHDLDRVFRAGRPPARSQGLERSRVLRARRPASARLWTTASAADAAAFSARGGREDAFQKRPRAGGFEPRPRRGGPATFRRTRETGLHRQRRRQRRQQRGEFSSS